MGEQFTMRAPTDYRVVDLQDPAEAEYWVLVLDASRRQIEDAIARVGNEAGAVRACLKGLMFREPSLARPPVP